MERLALVSAVFFSLLIATSGSLSTAKVAARKGYNPRLGALVGWLTGFGAGMLSAVIFAILFSGAGAIIGLGSLFGGLAGLMLLWQYLPARQLEQGILPSGEALKLNIAARHVQGNIMRFMFILSIVIALVALATLMWTIINKSIGFTAVQYMVQPEALTITSYESPGDFGQITLDEAKAMLAENVRVVRLQNLVLSTVVAEPGDWPELYAQPVSVVLGDKLYPEAVAAIPVNELDAAQAVDILASNLEPGDLRLLVFTEAGRSLEVLSEHEITAVLAERLSQDAINQLPANLGRPALEELILLETSGRALRDLSERELGSILAGNIRKALLRVFLLENVVKASEDEWADLSPKPLNEALKGKIYPDTLAEVPLNKLTELQAADILANNLDRSALEKLVYDNVVQPEVIESWSLWDSLTDRTGIEDKTALENPLAEVKWHSWVSWDFITSQLDPRRPDTTGIRPALYGSLLVVLITISVAFPVGVGAAIYLEEYAGKSRLNQIIQTNINNLAGVPSIIYGILGLAIFVRALETITSGNAFGTDTANGRTVLSAGFTLALLILPMIIINAQEAIRAVPSSLRQASYGLGATHWQTIWNHVLPYAMPGIMTGTILAISRAIGETAPLILVGGATYLTQDPEGPFSIFTALPLLIYRWTTLPQAEFRNAAAAAIVVLLVLLLTMNSIAVILRNRFSRRLS
jgi:phosphate transport system permease protein